MHGIAYRDLDGDKRSNSSKISMLVVTLDSRKGVTSVAASVRNAQG
jgi:hypothetical protein